MINLNAGINNTGYGCVATNIFLKLFQKYPDLSLFPIGQCFIAEKHIKSVERAQSQGIHHFNADNPSLRIWHQFSMAERYSKRLSAGLTFFELDQLKQGEVCHLNGLDIVFVASKWAKTIVDSQCSVQCEVLPMGCDETIFTPKKQESENNKPYRFFTSGKIEIRKGYDVLCDMFNKAFKPEDNVELYIKWENAFLSQTEMDRWEKLYKESPLGDKIIFVRAKSQEEIANMINFCDCGVFPTKAEGFGLNILEAIYCNKPVIVTNYSAPTEFCNPDNSTLIEPDSLEEARDGRWFFGEGNWAKLGENYQESFVDSMRRHYYKDIRNNPGRPATQAAYNWDICIDRLCKHLNLET